MSSNPFQTPSDPVSTKQVKAEPLSPTSALSPAHAAYNVVSDTVTGVNVRWSDNKFQAVFVFASIAVAAVLGGVLAWLNTQWDLPWYGGAMIGSFLGMVFGIFASGIFLMFYRAARHFKGKHD